CLHSICALTLPFPESRLFQKKTLDLGAADGHVSDLLDVLAKRRETCDEEFALVFEQVKELSDKILLAVEVPRITQRQVHRNSPPRITPEEYYRRFFIPILDSVISDLKSRFSRHTLNSFRLTVQLPSNIVNCTDDLLQSSVKEISSMYGQLIGLTMPSTTATLILAEVHVCRSRWLRVKREGGIFPSSVEETAKECDRHQYPYVSSLLDIFVSLPVSVASAGHSFSTSRKLKIWLRAQIRQTRLSGLALLNVHRDIDISIDRVIDSQLQNYLMWQVVKSFISTLPKSFRDAGKILRKALLGTDYTEEVWRYCVGDTNSILGFAVGSLFVRKTFHEESKQIAEEMIRSVRDAFIGNFPSLTWMDEKTRDAAKEKAIAITSMIGFPDFILNKDKLDEYYKDLHVIESEYFKNTLRSNQFSQRQNLKNLGEPVNKTEWGMPPATVNAYYTPNKNQIVFPAGILQKPFFDVTAPPSLNFGGMGVVVGHELTHAFDDQGREFDKNGDMKPWWNNETITKFQQRADCIADQYSSYSVNDEMVSGKQTIGENIADNGGLKAAFHAYQRWVKRMDIQERKLPGLNFTAPQLFFLSFAQ
ncbi:hypothetical protein QYM36_017782, partial [Artemia franciscana]